MKSSHKSWGDPPPGFDPENVAPHLLKENAWPVTALALDVSGTCNLACRYCAEAATQPLRQPMTLGIFKKAWDAFFGSGAAKHNFSLRLGSGEPLIAFPLLRQIADIVKADCKARGIPQPAVFLTTNGTLIDDEIGDWLLESGWNVKISIDGPDHLHDAWRVGPGGVKTYSIVKKGIERFVKEMPDRLSVTAVLCRGADPCEVFNSIAGLGVRRIEMVPVAHADKSFLPSREDRQRYEAFVLEYATRFVKDGPDGLPHLIRFGNRVVRVLGYNNCRIHCGAGRNFLAVGPDGNIFPCFRLIGLPAYRLGSVDDGIDIELAGAFRNGVGRAYDLREQCRQCWAAPLCGGPCAAISATFGVQGSSVPSLYCAYTVADSRVAIWMVNELRKQNPERLLYFLPKSIADFYES